LVSLRVLLKRRSRRLLITTRTLEKAIAAPAISGLRYRWRERERGDVAGERPAD
jgi:hypothetical protein